MNIEMVPGEKLIAAPWRTTYIVKPDLEVLVRSMTDHGWLQPIIVRRENNMIIDGHYRWEIAGQVKQIRRSTKGLIPVIYNDCTDIHAQLIHIQMNRGRGSTFAKPASKIVRNLINSKLYDESELRKILSMSADEFDVMYDGTLIKSRKIAEHKYSRAWVPVEAPASITDQAEVIERPPNADR